MSQTASRRFLKGQVPINGIMLHLITIQPTQVPEDCLLKRYKKQLVAWSRFLRTSDLPFHTNTDVKNIKLKGHSTGASSSEKTSTLITDVFKKNYTLPFRKFSSYSKLPRIVAYCMRLPRHFAYPSSGKEIVNPEELNAAEQKLQVIIQSESFPIERQQLAQEKQINKKSRIAVYSPFIGPGGLLRSTGRIKPSAEIDFDLKHPIIIDGRNLLVVLFLRHMHLKHHHEGADYLRALTQRRFAVLKFVQQSVLFDSVEFFAEKEMQHPSSQ